MAEIVPFNKPHMTGKELYTIAQAHFNSVLAGDGPYTRLCHKRLEEMCHSQKVLLTHSCTAALEMQSLLLAIGEGDEVIMPSYTFVSTANAVVLRGGVPVFVDIRADTLNIDETLVAQAIGKKTRAIAPVHYAGVGCEMDTLLAIAKQHNLMVIEDAAQGFMATYKERPLGSIGHLGALSFHETKNVICGEGGALLVNDAQFSLKAEIIREKGTDRSRFFRGEVDKYTWQDIGSSYLPGELVAAFLWAQLEEACEITANRLASWERYHTLLADLEAQELLRRPIVPAECRQNGHMYYILLHPRFDRQRVLSGLKENGIHAVFHYVPLHTAPAGRKYCRVHGSLSVTEDSASRLIRLPLWYGIPEAMQIRTVEVLGSLLRNA
ncbi:MAG: dTDP-4-amino-4,6-dideoxygalactose transaminase [Desulfovibrionaceae bacterium]|nr:dTDP-4-amino-4,6-dideoxygalactose transaminase [Desulfovibrionaceae bacterium]